MSNDCTVVPSVIFSQDTVMANTGQERNAIRRNPVTRKISSSLTNISFHDETITIIWTTFKKFIEVAYITSSSLCTQSDIVYFECTVPGTIKIQFDENSSFVESRTRFYFSIVTRKS